MVPWCLNSYKLTANFHAVLHFNRNWWFPGCRKDKPLRFGQDYGKCFDVQQYLQSYTNFSSSRYFPLEELHKLCADLNVGPKSLSVLDIGTGPCTAYLISIAPYASKIVLAEYAAPNRAALTAWLENQKHAYDWTPYFKKIVTEIEGKDEIEVQRRVTMVREKVKAVVPCDITISPPVPQEYMCQYDIVQSFLCLQSACQTKEECFAGIARMALLVKPGGKIILYFAELEEVKGKSFYPVGSQMFFSLPISKVTVVKCIEDAGFHDINLATLPREHVDNPVPNLICFYFVSATKD